jgi:hypothetical protein
MLRITSFAIALSMLGLASHAAAQTCGAGQSLLKNDNLPANPGGATQVSVIPGLCEGEAAAAVFDISALGNAVRVHSAAIGYFNAGGATGIEAAVNLEIYDGVTFSGGIPTLGPKIFDFEEQTGGNVGISSSAINETSLASFNILATSTRLVVAWRMGINGSSGSCAVGYTTNFATDNTCQGLGCGCNAGSQKNLIFIQGQGWRDAATATVSGFPICPLFYNGNWIIRACVEPVGCVQPASIGPGTPGSGGIAPLLTTSGGDPSIGNNAFGLFMTAGLGGAPSAMLFGAQEAFLPFAGGHLYLIPLISLPVSLGGPAGTPGAGFATVPFPIPASPGIIGAALPIQSVVVDPAAPLSLALTNGLRVTICP